MGKVRMADIAAKVGVSIVTVHNALTGQKGVSDEMRSRIRKTAEELGYHQMSAAAKRERNRGGLRNIGVIISEKYLASYTTFYWKMYQEINTRAVEQGCFVLLEIISEEGEKNLELPKMVKENMTLTRQSVRMKMSRPTLK